MDKVLENLFSRLEPCPSIFVAGGYAASPATAGDIDIWFGHNRFHLANNFLMTFPIRNVVEEGTAKQYEGMSTMFGSGWDYEIGRVVQVLVTPYKKAEEVLKGFDISSHQIAVTSKGKVVKGEQYTDPWTQLPKILSNTPQTLARYVKICKRYGWAPDEEEMKEWFADLMEEMKDPKEKGLDDIIATHLQSPKNGTFKMSSLKSYVWTPGGNSLNKMWGDTAVWTQYLNDSVTIVGEKAPIPTVDTVGGYPTITENKLYVLNDDDDDIPF